MFTWCLKIIWANFYLKAKLCVGNLISGEKLLEFAHICVVIATHLRPRVCTDFTSCFHLYVTSLIMLQLLRGDP